MRASRMRDEKTFELKTLNPNHSRYGVIKSNNKNASTKWVTRLLVEDVR